MFQNSLCQVMALEELLAREEVPAAHAESSQREKSSAIINNDQESSTSISHQLPSTSISHYQPLLTIVNNHQASSTHSSDGSLIQHWLHEASWPLRLSARVSFTTTDVRCMKDMNQYLIFTSKELPKCIQTLLNIL